jgi:hypothetical protein
MFKMTMRRKSKYALKKKSQTMKKSVKKYLSAKNQIEFRDLEEVSKHFKLFFKAIIDIDENDYNGEQREKYDMKKDRILDKLDNIERKDPILRRIKSISPEIYTKLGYSNTNIPYLELVDTYYSILKKLETIIIEDDALGSDASLIQSIMIEDLVHTFIKKKKTLSSIDDDLLDMFRGLGVKSDLDDLQTMFRTMKVDF